MDLPIPFNPLVLMHERVFELVSNIYYYFV